MKTPPHTLLLATDLSCRCDRALDRATELAKAWKSRLVVVHVLEHPAAGREWQGGMRPEELALSRVRRDLRNAEGLDLHVVVERGEPVSVVLDVARRFEVGLILTGVARNETLGRLLLGNTVTALLRQASVPVLVVKTRPHGLYRSFVVATDFSEDSRQALEVAAAMLPKARTGLFHRFDIEFKGLIDDVEGARELARREAEAASREFLESTPATQGDTRGVEVCLDDGETGEQLQRFVTSKGYELAVLGTAGRRGIAGVLLGSVAQALVSRLDVDVLLVRRGTTVEV